MQQVGSMPLLSREEELAAARRVADYRTEFRRALYASDYVLLYVSARRSPHASVRRDGATNCPAGRQDVRCRGPLL